MKTYFNNEDKVKHIYVVACQSIIENLKDSPTLTDEERKCLETAYKNILKFNGLVFKRMGEPYKRKIIRTAVVNNKIDLVSRYAPDHDMTIEYSPEDLEKNVQEFIGFQCFSCERKDYLTCPVYAMGQACDIVGTNDNDCPYRG